MRITLLLLALLAPLCAADGPALAAGWSRATAPTATVGAVFGSLRNPGAAEDALVGASSPASASVELHAHQRKADGTVGMMQVERIAIPAGGATVLKPGDFHLMLIDLKTPLVEGQNIALTLRFASGASVETFACVGAAAAMEAPACGVVCPLPAASATSACCPMQASSASSACCH